MITNANDITGVELKLCMVCLRPSTYQCARCKCVFYCNKDHQKADWLNHRKYCGMPAEQRSSYIRVKQTITRHRLSKMHDLEFCQGEALLHGMDIDTLMVLKQVEQEGANVKCRDWGRYTGGSCEVCEWPYCIRCESQHFVCKKCYAGRSIPG